MNVNAFKDCARRYRNLLQEIEDLHADLRDLEAETKAQSGCNNMDLRAMKRWLKADVKGTADKLAEQADNDRMIGDVLGLTDKNSVDKKTVDSEQDTREDRSGTAREAPGTRGERRRRPDAGAQPAGPPESRAKPEASAPAPEQGSGEDPDHAAKGAGQSGSRASGGAGTAAPVSEIGSVTAAPAVRPTPEAPREGTDSSAADYFDIPEFARRTA